MPKSLLYYILFQLIISNSISAGIILSNCRASQAYNHAPEIFNQENEIKINIENHLQAPVENKLKIEIENSVIKLAETVIDFEEAIYFLFYSEKDESICKEIIEQFKIKKETSISKNIRNIFALIGQRINLLEVNQCIFDFMQNLRELLKLEEKKQEKTNPDSKEHKFFKRLVIKLKARKELINELFASQFDGIK